MQFSSRSFFHSSDFAHGAQSRLQKCRWLAWDIFEVALTLSSLLLIDSIRVNGLFFKKKLKTRTGILRFWEEKTVFFDKVYVFMIVGLFSSGINRSPNWKKEVFSFIQFSKNWQNFQFCKKPKKPEKYESVTYNLKHL